MAFPCLMDNLLDQISLGLQQTLSDNTEKPNYDELSERIERFSKWIHFAFIKVSFRVSLGSLLLTTLINYIVKGMGDDSYQDGTIM